MTAESKFDAFSVLGLKRSLTISSEQIDGAWRELSRELHPDADTGDAEKIAAVNRARETLNRPAMRLRHWLTLQGVEIGRDTVIDGDLMDLFTEVGPVLQETDTVLKEKAAASSALGKALLTEREIAAQQKLQALLGDLQKRKLAVTDRFSDFESADDFSDAISATGTLGFLEKWESQVQERLISIISSG